jgi:hypothetical protein
MAIVSHDEFEAPEGVHASGQPVGEGCRSDIGTTILMQMYCKIDEIDTGCHNREQYTHPFISEWVVVHVEVDGGDLGVTQQRQQGAAAVLMGQMVVLEIERQPSIATHRVADPTNQMARAGVPNVVSGKTDLQILQTGSAWPTGRRVMDEIGIGNVMVGDLQCHPLQFGHPMKHSIPQIVVRGDVTCSNQGQTIMRHSQIFIAFLRVSCTW